MKSTILWALAGLNAVLLVFFAGSFGHLGAAQAQARRPANYLLVPGEVNAWPSAIVYIVDMTDGRLGAMTYDDSSHTLQTMPPLNLNTVYDAARPRR